MRSPAFLTPRCPQPDAAPAAIALGGHRAGARALPGPAHPRSPRAAAAAGHRPGSQLRRRGFHGRSRGAGGRPAPQAHAVSGVAAGGACDCFVWFCTACLCQLAHPPAAGRYPYVTGTSVLGITYKDGVLLASDTLGGSVTASVGGFTAQARHRP